ncbi:uncharacterized protein METZ01_LOCUS67233 [marine metagenome]|uniref:Uncharacterized protein n=1 Tax=marine metagenome TaxID=408172 RepID=A0A381TF59_9ZZZZ
MNDEEYQRSVEVKLGKLKAHLDKIKKLYVEKS